MNKKEEEEHPEEEPWVNPKNLTRLNKDIAELKKADFDQTGIRFDDCRDDARVINVSLKSSNDSIYYGGVFHIRIAIPGEFPFEPPQMRMKTKIYHCNINEEMGFICVNILTKSWAPTNSLLNALVAIRVLLDNPNPIDFLDYDKALEYQNNINEYTRKAKEYVKIYAQE